MDLLDALRAAGAAGVRRRGHALAAGSRGGRGGALLSPLTLVGTGYRVAGQVTPETWLTMERADCLFYLVTDPATSGWLRSLNPRARSLHDCYREGEDGTLAAGRMVARMLAPLRAAATAAGGEGTEPAVCAAFYGHPAVLVHPARLAAEQARAEGFAVHMLPAISCEDCLFADLGVDPAVPGRVLCDATDFLLRPRRFDTSAALVLLQAGAVGVRRFHSGREPSRAGLRLLAEALGQQYPADHPVVLYEIDPLPPFDPRILRLPLAELAEAPASVVTTLYVTPLPPPAPDVERRLRLQASATAG
ncbi:MAG TPA: SAM-dependent methyltransferase [Thermoanaerobaculia bacterium]|nr:SAM-dependent methyltransferase [Thermoanaerobaculia bacterium]